MMKGQFSFVEEFWRPLKKLGWAPDLIHCHGWMTSLIPLYLKTSYKDEPLFENAKVVTSVYNDCFEGSLDANFSKKSDDGWGF